MAIYYYQGKFLDSRLHEGKLQGVEIPFEEYKIFLTGLKEGSTIIEIDGKPQIFPPRPSEYHELENGKWVLSKVKQHEQLKQKKSALIGKLLEKTDRLNAVVFEGYSQVEIDSFYRQEKEARGWKADNSYETPMLTAIAENRKIHFELLVEKVIEKADFMAAIIGDIIGMQQGFEDRIKQATNVNALKKIENEIEQWKSI